MTQENTVTRRGALQGAAALSVGLAAGCTPAYAGFDGLDALINRWNELEALKAIVDEEYAAMESHPDRPKKNSSQWDEKNGFNAANRRQGEVYSEATRIEREIAAYPCDSLHTVQRKAAFYLDACKMDLDWSNYQEDFQLLVHSMAAPTH
ncbi:MAG: hypothetical protein MnENMB40S_28980 [Rhizobiaceae bacterium MnEN-MB40S]|nr:MAG: hypothetical protein MnENMB40S_28980 [Rhizobiaceae bacterium MnEN-MB40S]